MAVDFSLPPEILVIHGVQTVEDADLRQHDVVQSNLEALLSNPDLHFDDPLDFRNWISI